MSTIRDVARESGYSPATVSIVLNDAPLAKYIPPATKAVIHKAAKKLGYRPNIAARSLRSKRSHAVGLMVFDITDPYCTLILRGIQSALYQAHYMPVLTDVQNDRARFERFLEMLLDRHVEGLILLANWLFMDIHLIADLAGDKIPSVVIGRELEKGPVSSVLVDNEAGGAMAIVHLHSLGHRNIVVIRGPKALRDSADRWKGIRRFAEAKGIKLDPALIVDLPESSDPMSGFEASSEAMVNLARKHRFTAVLAFDDVSALGALRGLAQVGLRVPDDCSVIGFDDIAPASLATPRLTTIRQPMESMGEMAVSILMDAVVAKREKRAIAAVHRKIAPALVVRDSTMELRRSLKEAL